MPPILENNEHKYSRYMFQLAAYGCKSGAMVNCNPSRRAWRARALQTVFRSRETQAVVMKWLGSRSRHISVQWCKNMLGGLKRPEMQSMTWLLQLVSQHPAVPPVLSRRSHPTMAGMLLPCIAQGKCAAGAPRISQSCTHKAEQNYYLSH